MPRDRSGRTYRVRQIPSYVSRDSLARLLINLCPALGPEENIITCSLASSLVPFETLRTKTATVNFKKLPEIFDNDDTEWVLPTGNGQASIIIDVHFLGFTALNDVESDLHALDCISISGLASHPFGSWAERNPKSNFMWLRDRLPQDLKQVRSIIYGYDSRLLQSESFQSIDDIAITFIAQLKSMGRSLKAVKPAVVLAHSLGGIIIKRALLEMANSGDVEEYMLSFIQEVIFFGVPNRGMEMEQWLPMVQGQPNEALVRLLAPGSLPLIDLDQRFDGISNTRNIRLISFYETQRSQTAERNPSTGKWAISGPFKVLVSKDSAQQQGSRKSDVLPINKNHSDMVKFREGSEEYQIVARYIYELIDSINDPSRSSRMEKHNLVLSEQPLQPASSSAKADIDLAQNLLHSLDLGDIRHRFKRIEDAYGPTFQWIWTDPDVGFASWLASGTDAYWISGKPGSGKSTLMKYIFKHYQEMASPNTVSPRRTHIHAGFFFHDRGSHLQKSFEGLLYSIIHQILSSASGLIQAVSHIYSRRPLKNRAHWSLGDLEEALRCILNQTRLPVDILLFLDALDEYSGRPDFIADFIKRMIGGSKNSVTRIRICFSSRLWNVFVDQFQEFPGFKIHERTEVDILAYINGKFKECPGMARLLHQESKTQHSGASALMSGLVERAEGVFLWLKLVMNEILNAVTEGALLPELLEILTSFPEELEDLYTELIKRIPKEFRMESYAMLEIVLRSAAPIHSYDFWLATACAPCRTLGDCISKIPVKAFITPFQYQLDSRHLQKLAPEIRSSFYVKVDEAIGDHDQYQRRLKSRCGGLIEEVPYRHDEYELKDTTLQFMHQTVKDFVSKPGFRQLITNEDDELKENGYSFLAKYGLAQLTMERRRFSLPGYSSLPQYAPYPPEWFSYLFYASPAESSSGTSQKHLLDVASEAFMPARSEDDVYGLFGSAASFGVVANLELYIQQFLSGDDRLALRRLMGHDDLKVSTLLHDVARVINDPREFIPKSLIKTRFGQFQRRSLGLMRILNTFPLGDSSKMANILLKAGANQSSIYNGMTPFQTLISGNYEVLVEEPRRYFFRVIEVALEFLKNSQDPNTEVLGQRYSSGPTQVKCMPLHLANSSLAQILLEYGADVNALDGTGLTPLDVAFEDITNIHQSSLSLSPNEWHKLLLLLLDHGGCVTEEGASLVHKVLEIFTEDGGYSLDRLDDRLKTPPRLHRLTANTEGDERPRGHNDASALTFPSQSSKTSKSSRFKKALPRLFKRSSP